MARSPRLISLVVASALLVLAPAASASTHLLRPVSTAAGGQWSVTPAGSDLAAALADDVVQPVAPATATGFVTSPSKGNSTAAALIAAPSLATGENITGATAWVYLSTGSTRSATVAISTATTLLGMVTVPAGRSPQWVAVPASAPPTPAQMAALYLAIAPSGSSSAVTAYAAYVDLETDAPGATTAGSDSAAAGTGSSHPGTAANDGSAGGSPDNSLAATVAPAAALVVRSTGLVPVPISCPVVQLSGCRGTVTIELFGTSAGSHDKALSVARRRKIALRSTRHFKVAAGAAANVPVVLDRRTARVLRRKGRVRARITVTTDLGAGKRVVATRTVNLRARRTARPTQRVTGHGGTRH
jgi:hypothetical protein